MTSASSLASDAILVEGRKFSWELCPDAATPGVFTLRFGHALDLGLAYGLRQCISTFRLSACCETLIGYRKPRRSLDDVPICSLCEAPIAVAGAPMAEARDFATLLALVEEAALDCDLDPMLQAIMKEWIRESVEQPLAELALANKWLTEAIDAPAPPM